MILVSTTGQEIADNMTSAADSFMKQLANLEFSNALFYVALMLAAAIICFEGYRLYKLALIVLGFYIGYSRSHVLLAGMELTSEQQLIGQAIAGILLAVLAGTLVHVGIYIAAYHFAQTNLAGLLTPILLQHVEVPKLLEPIATRIAAVLIAAIIAWLAVKSERVVVVVLTAVIGGFAMVNFFLKMVPVFPVNIGFFLKLPPMAFVIAKIGISAAGVGVQGVRKSKM